MAISTGRSGFGLVSQVVQIYAPPYVASIPKGATVTYGNWVTVPAGGGIPAGPAILEFQSGSGEMQADNQVVWRTVTIT